MISGLAWHGVSADAGAVFCSCVVQQRAGAALCWGRAAIVECKQAGIPRPAPAPSSFRLHANQRALTTGRLASDSGSVLGAAPSPPAQKHFARGEQQMRARPGTSRAWQRVTTLLLVLIVAAAAPDVQQQQPEPAPAPPPLTSPVGAQEIPASPNVIQVCAACHASGACAAPASAAGASEQAHTRQRSARARATTAAAP